MPLIAFLLFTHARLQDNACAMSHDSYVGSNLLCILVYQGRRQGLRKGGQGTRETILPEATPTNWRAGASQPSLAA